MRKVQEAVAALDMELGRLAQEEDKDNGRLAQEEEDEGNREGAVEGAAKGMRKAPTAKERRAAAINAEKQVRMAKRSGKAPTAKESRTTAT